MRRKREESGFALLLVLLMSAMIAIALYNAVPRVAMESQRQKEQLLIVRGEEYKRAILVFYKNNNRWPSKIEDLENTNNRHYLRRRFIDPMTGKDEWRLIHTQNGILTDSLINKPKTTDQKPGDSTAGQYVGTGGGMFDVSNGATGSTGPNLGRRRISDGGTGGGTMVSMDPTGGSTAANGNATAPPPADGSTGPTGPVAAPVAPIGTNPDGSQPPPMPPGFPPGSVPPGFVPPGGMPPGTPGFPGAPVNSQTGGVSPSPYPTTPGANGMPPGFPQPGATGAGGAAQNMIQQILGSPRPGGAPMGTTTAGGGLVIGGGIAGVASKLDAEGIMVYGDHTNYKEWEFVFDPTKWRPPPNPLSSSTPAGTPASQLGNLQQTQIGTSVSDIVAQQNGTATGASGSTGSTGATGSTSPIVH